ncbi:MAG: hypothetical protein KH334_02835 [Clostridiales bacterium]|nr:hypothetical protein [Clostridiales bacterium]
MSKNSNTSIDIQALQKLAEGYEYEEKEILVGRNGKPEKMRVFKKHMPPNLKAIEEIAYLKKIGMLD